LNDASTNGGEFPAQHPDLCQSHLGGTVERRRHPELAKEVVRKLLYHDGHGDVNGTSSKIPTMEPGKAVAIPNKKIIFHPYSLSFVHSCLGL